MKEITVEAVKDNLETVLDFLDTEMDNKKIKEDIKNNIKLAAEEVFVNIADYAYTSQLKGNTTVRIETENVIILEFEDSGIRYNPLEREDPDITAPIEERDIGGLGVFIVKKIMDTVEYRYENGKNILTIKKER